MTSAWPCDSPAVRNLSMISRADRRGPPLLHLYCGGLGAAGADEHLGDLDRVEGRALAQLIAADEQVEAEPLGLRQVAADAAHVDRIAARGDRRHREAVAVALVDDLDAGGL